MTKHYSTLTAVILAVAYIPSAHAYLDPGTGSLIIQGAIAAVGAGLVAGRLYWTKLKGLFRRSTPSPNAPDDGVDEAPSERQSEGDSGD